MCLTPVCDSASISAIFRSVAITPFSNWKPSRGPSSLISTNFGRSDIETSSLPIIRGKIGRDLLGVGIVNRRAESFDHLRDLTLPAGLVDEGCIHLNIVEAVAGAAIVDHRVA